MILRPDFEEIIRNFPRGGVYDLAQYALELEDRYEEIRLVLANQHWVEAGSRKDFPRLNS